MDRVEQTKPLIQATDDYHKRKRDKGYRTISCLLAFFIFAAVAIAVYLAYYRTTYNRANSVESVCMTPACVELAGDILRAMNSTVDPCQDFYQYACGGWINSHVLPDYLGRLVTFSILEELNNDRLREKLSESSSSGPESGSKSIAKAKELYASCMDLDAMNEVGRKPIDELIVSFGGWSVQKETFDQATWKMEKALAKIGATVGMPFFGLDVTPDQKNTSRNLITFSQGG